MDIVKVKDNDDVVRDKKSKAILNVDQQGLIAYREQRKRRQKLDDMEQRLNTLENKIDKIIELLQK